MTVFVETLLEFFDLCREEGDLLLKGRYEFKEGVGSLIIDCLELCARQYTGFHESRSPRVASRKRW